MAKDKLKSFLSESFVELKIFTAFDWCKSETTGKFLLFDFIIPKHNVIIELDNLDAQFFRRSGREEKNCVDEQLQRDLYKMDCANANGWTVIRFLQEDVWYDRMPWKEELKRFIRPGGYPYPTRIFVSSDPNIYLPFMKSIQN